ncbi:hypothetical protein EDC04DRAFT_2599865 [Pisolithus marmoratus]|nr:hypothetical protein EDC04DRAFT_2599865 [Pisolithus marmoratus]
MPHTAKAMDTPTVNSTDLHTRVLQNHKILTPQHPSNPGDAGVAFPDGQKKRVKPRHAVQPPEGWEEHVFGYRDRRRSLMPHMSLPSMPSSLSQKEGHIPKEDAEMDIPKKSSDGEEEGDEGKDRDSESNGNNVEDDGPATESSLPSSSPPPPLPSNSSDTEDYLLQLCQPCQTNNKGKGRAIDVEDTNVAGSNSDALPRSKKPGTLSCAALNDICEFLSKVKKEAEELGRHYSRSTHDILVAAGFGVKPSHMKLNEANLFCSWYWAMQPKPDGAKRDAINNIITQKYNSLIKDILKDDTAARREKLKHIYEWSENSSVAPTNKSVKSIATRVQNAKTQFSGLAEAWSNLEEIEIIGVVMYVGQDPAGRQTSGIFGGSDVVRNFINQHTVDIHTLMDKYTSIFKCLRDGSSSEAGLLGRSSTAVFGRYQETWNRLSIWKYDKGEQVTRGIEVGNPQKIVWQGLLEFMTKKYLIILNWPIGVSLPGPGFEYKKLKADPLRKLVLGMMYDGQSDDDEEQDSLDGVPEIEIRPWSQDIISMSESHHLKGEIPLIKAADGVKLPTRGGLKLPARGGPCSSDPSASSMDLRRDVPNRTNTRDRGLSQPLPRWHEDRRYERANYNDPGLSNVPYNLMPPIHQNIHRNFPPSHQPYHHIPSRDRHVYHDGPFINDYNPAAQPTQQHWVNRGNTMRYDDDFDGDYLEEDY